MGETYASPMSNDYANDQKCGTN